ncbi:hypothetical protein SASPL_128284 [Salvia splendens]|uniref:Uncharacterized protein n=1 Tax=Salvia splendens TaxID=180675 RepID=A0A8X8ZML0_SALSN|nr:hypothetical protein SASPL_128284 [Salvia splendens]
MNEEASAMKAKMASSHNSLRLADPRFAEEDYIVFCFGEDGEIHLINNDRRSAKGGNGVDRKPPSYAQGQGRKTGRLQALLYILMRH